MVTSMMDLLAQLGANARQLGGPTSPERMQTALDLLAVMDFLAVPHDGGRLLKAVGHLMQMEKVSDAPFAAFLKSCQPEELFYPLDGSQPYEQLYKACPECRGDIALQEALDHIARWLPQAMIPADELVVILAGDMGLKGEELSIAHYMSVRARRLLQEHPSFGLPDAVRDLEAELQAMGKFSDTLYDRKGFKPLPGIIYVTTCHSAKGLEWDTVFVPSLTRGEYPSMSQDKIRSELWFLPDDYMNPEALALAELDAIQGEDLNVDAAARAKFEMINERLRLLYVAITRARENLMLSCHLEDRWGKPAYPALAYHHLKGFIEKRGQSRE
jgi:DNA helicase-2/ATP-dependent DNA helicase PcrA